MTKSIPIIEINTAGNGGAVEPVTENKKRRGHSARGLTLEATGRGLRMTPSPSKDAMWAEWLSLMRQGIATRETIPQGLADSWFEIAAKACKWFHYPDFRMLPAVEYMDGADDEEVRSRIAGFQVGYDKEYSRRATLAVSGRPGGWIDYYTQEEMGERESYDFSKWPFWLQRTVVSHWDRLHYEYLSAHDLCYNPREGYYWDIEGYHVKHLDMDKGVKPTANDLEMNTAEFYRQMSDDW